MGNKVGENKDRCRLSKIVTVGGAAAAVLRDQFKNVRTRSNKQYVIQIMC